jgi:hypothetical protein
MELLFSFRHNWQIWTKLDTSKYLKRWMQQSNFMTAQKRDDAIVVFF